MKLIIDIPDKVYNEYREGVMSMENNCTIGNAVFDGKPYEERPQGKWIKNTDTVFINRFNCSICGKLIFEPKEDNNFCSNCGAKMKGGAE